MLKEFREFAMKGNVVDLAIGVIIGAAFGAIVTSLVADIIMPIIGSVTGGLDFSNYFIGLSKTVTATNLADAKKQGAVLAWGNFLTLTLNFLIVAFVLFHRHQRDEQAEAQGREGIRVAAEAEPRGRTADRNPRSPEGEGIGATPGVADRKFSSLLRQVR
jgi:large conductance mechanosensitive channel